MSANRPVRNRDWMLERTSAVDNGFPGLTATSLSRRTREYGWEGGRYSTAITFWPSYSGVDGCASAAEHAASSIRITMLGAVKRKNPHHSATCFGPALISLPSWVDSSAAASLSALL